MTNINFSLKAVAELTVASYEEDKFGVVQKSLPDSITSLLILQEVILCPNKEFPASRYVCLSVDRSSRYHVRVSIPAH